MRNERDTTDNNDARGGSAHREPREGDYVRRRDERAPQRYTPWGQIAMTVPSASGTCWLVSFIDGEVDVWRVDDTSAGYQFRSATTPQRGTRP
jgi:hypothetical protein